MTDFYIITKICQIIWRFLKNVSSPCFFNVFFTVFSKKLRKNIDFLLLVFWKFYARQMNKNTFNKNKNALFCIIAFRMQGMLAFFDPDWFFVLFWRSHRWYYGQDRLRSLYFARFASCWRCGGFGCSKGENARLIKKRSFFGDFLGERRGRTPEDRSRCSATFVKRALTCCFLWIRLFFYGFLAKKLCFSLKNDYFFVYMRNFVDKSEF